MKENQITEFKETWKDEYLKQISAFANGQGGKLYIGIDDSGEIIGLNYIKKLLEDIPNKIQSTLGILAKVNEYTQNDLNYLEIEINPSSFPVSYHGEYFIRSGSTTQKLTGFALTEFIINKTGFHWEDVTVDNISVEDLDEESFRIFKKAALKSKRMSSEELNISIKNYLKN